jgi:casein kinase I family protein HRR25
MEKKLVTPIETLCRGLPEEIMEFFTYSRSIEFEDEPDYQKLKQLLLKVMQREGVRPDSEIEWGCDLTIRKSQS